MTTKPARNVRLDPMTPDEYPPWRAMVAAEYALAQVGEGHWAIETAQRQGWDVVTDLLPAGPATPDHHLWVARDTASEQRVGALWVELRRAATGAGAEAFIYDIHVEEDLRGGGYGRAIMVAAAAAARALGAEAVALNVHGANDRAYRLYKSLGYGVTNRHMRLGL